MGVSEACKSASILEFYQVFSNTSAVQHGAQGGGGIGKAMMNGFVQLDIAGRSSVGQCLSRLREGIAVFPNQKPLDGKALVEDVLGIDLRALALVFAAVAAQQQSGPCVCALHRCFQDCAADVVEIEINSLGCGLLQGYQPIVDLVAINH